MKKSTKKPICCGKEMYACGGAIGLLPDGSNGDLVHCWRCDVCKREFSEIMQDGVIAYYDSSYIIKHNAIFLQKEYNSIQKSNWNNTGRTECKYC